jgi:hypothetical protein
MRPSFSNPSRAVGPTCRARLSKRGETARHPGPYPDNIPVLVARDRKGATFDAVLPQDDGKPLAAFARRAKIPFHAVPSPGKPTPEAPHLHIKDVNAYHRRLKQWLNRLNGVATKNLPVRGRAG